MIRDRHTDDDIAIVGMGCVLPGARSPAQLWSAFQSGTCAIKPLQGGAWDWSRYLDATGADLDKATAILGARIDDYTFDWRTFRMPPADVDAVNPLQLMILDAGHQALSGVRKLPNETTGLFIGATGLGWQRDTGLRLHLGELVEALEASPQFQALGHRRAAVIDAMRRSLDQRLKPVSEDNVVGAAASVAAGRIAMHFDLRGLHYAVDAGFASSLAALDVGVRALRDGTVDCAVVGGASELLTPLELVAFSRLGGLARTRVAPFDKDAEGTLLGEGTAIFALKRLDDAVRDGETIHAVVLGVGGSSDGRGKSVVAPRPEGQALAMRAALADADVDASSVSFIECHATGTQVGDASEARALASVYGESARRIALGSAKAFVGHLRGAAGAVGLLRAVLALSHGKIPRQIAVNAVNPALELAGTPFFIPDSEQHFPDDVERRAAVSAFGFGGNNHHAILAGPEAARRSTTHASGQASRRSSSSARRDSSGAIAICGMGGLFPTGNDIPTFWGSLLDGADATREVPADRWDIDRHYDADPARLDTSYTRLGCFLDELPKPDNTMGIPPSAFESLDPSHVLTLRAAEEAVAAVPGFARWDRARIAVHCAFLPYQGKKFRADLRVMFAEYQADLQQALLGADVAATQIASLVADVERRFKQDLPRITEDTLPGYLGSLVAGRITRRYDLHGPHFVVDSACASTHAAIHASMTALRHRTIDAALCGGVWCDMMPEFFVAACRFNALSPTGSTPFDKRANGFVAGEGAGMMVLRRLEDAERDGDPILAVLRSVAGSSDGRGRSVLAPRPEGEALAMTRALTAAGVDARDVDYVECHGTGTALGDAVEVDAMTRAYGGQRARALMIGSVKSNIGHLNAAAGMAGLIKAVFAVRDGIIPASLKVLEPNPAIDFAAGPVEVVTTNRAWSVAGGGPRRAGVSGFGVGGSNMHMIVEQHRATAVVDRPDSSGEAPLPPGNPGLPLQGRSGPGSMGGPETVTASSATLPAALVGLHAALADGLSGGVSGGVSNGGARPPSLRSRAGDGGVRVAVVARDRAELVRRAHLLDGFSDRPVADAAVLRAQGVFVGARGANARDAGGLAVMFPGQGTQYVNMLSTVLPRFPEARALLDVLEREYQRLAGRSLARSFLVDDEAGWRQRDEDIHCAVYAVNLALWRIFESRGARATVFIGQSAGEISALVAAGALSPEEGLRVVHARTTSVMSLDVADPGKMLSLRCGAERARSILARAGGYAVIAADNCPSACLVSADSAAAAAVLALCGEQDIEATVLPVSHAYHSEIIAPARVAYRRALDAVRFRPLSTPVISTITGASIASLPPGQLAAHLETQFVEPVRLQQAIRLAWDDGARFFLECGPKWPLSTFCDEILAGRTHVAQAAMHPKVGEVESVHRALASLWVQGRAELDQASVPAPASSSASSGAEPAPSSDIVRDLTTALASSGPAQARELLVAVRDAIDAFLAHSLPTVRSERTPERAPPAAAPAPATTVASPPAPSSSSSSSSASSSTPSSTVPQTPGGVDSQAAMELLVEHAVKRTGYPRAMLEPDLDLEADLGVDTVKQVALIADVKDRLGLPRDPSFKLRDHNTLRKIAGYLAALGGARAQETTTTTTTTTTSMPPPPPVSEAHPRVIELLLQRTAARTGYPRELLETGLDLEADLGIDTVKQVAIIAEVKQTLGLERDPSFKLREHNTLARIAAYLERQLGDAPAAATPPAASPSTSNAPSAAPSTAPSNAPSAVPATAPASEATPASPASSAPAAATALSRDEVTRRLLERVVLRTGYPLEMLELDLDLEADLGIDTVKQVAVIAELKQSLSLPRDPSFALRNHNTLRKIIDYLERVLTSGLATTPAETAASPVVTGERAVVAVPEAPPPPPEARASRSTAAQAQAVVAPAASFVDVVLRAPGLLDVRAAESSAIVAEAAAVELLVDAARKHGGVGRLVALEEVRFHRESAGLPKATTHIDAESRSRLRVALKATSHRNHAEAVVVLDHEAPASAGLASAEVRSAVSFRRAVPNGAALQQMVVRCAGDLKTRAELTEATILAHDEIVAVARLPAPGTVGGDPASAGGDAAVIGSVVHAAFALIALARLALGPHVTVLDAIASLTFARVPQRGEVLQLRGRLAAPLRGGVADVVVVDAEGRLVAEARGVRLSTHEAPLDPTAWRLLCQALRPAAAAASEQW